MNRNFVAIDFETANNSRFSACQLGLCLVKDGRIADHKVWLIKPPSRLFLFSDLHGITYDMVKNQMSFAELWPLVKPYIENNLVAAHNANFDVSVLTSTLAYYQIPVPQFSVVDSLDAARKTWPHLHNHKLSTVADFLNVELQHHDAGSDAKACAEIILRADLSLLRARPIPNSAYASRSAR